MGPNRIRCKFCPSGVGYSIKHYNAQMCADCYAAASIERDRYTENQDRKEYQAWRELAEKAVDRSYEVNR